MGGGREVHHRGYAILGLGAVLYWVVGGGCRGVSVPRVPKGFDDKNTQRLYFLIFNDAS